jgi:hypothetical protein
VYFVGLYHTGRFIIFFDIKIFIKTKQRTGPTLMELFTATGKLKNLFYHLQMFDACTTGDTAHIDTIFKFLPHTRHHWCIDILHCYNDPCLKAPMFTRV